MSRGGFKATVNRILWTGLGWTLAVGVAYNILGSLGVVQPRVSNPAPTRLGTAFEWFIIAVMVLVVVTAATILLLMTKRAFRSDNRRIDGSDRTRVHRFGWFWRKQMFVDTDRIHGPGYTIEGGEFKELAPSRYQLQENQMDAMVRLEQAANTGDIARMAYLRRDNKIDGGGRGGGRTGRSRRGQTKLPDMPREWREQAQGQPQKMLEQSINFNDIDIYGKAKGSYIPFAKNVVDGSVVGIDLIVKPHIALLGPSGSGKTTVMKSFIFSALAAGFKVSVSDCRGFNLWQGGWQSAAEMIDGRYPENILRKFAELNGEKLKRQAILAEHGAEDIYKLPPDVRPPPILFVIDDVTTTIEFIKMDDEKRQLDSYMNMLLPSCRAEGIHVMASDQQEKSGKDWLVAMTGNSVSIAGKTDRARANHGVGNMQAHKMEDNTFMVMGRVFKSPFYSPDQQNKMLMRFMDHKAAGVRSAPVGRQVADVVYDKTEYRIAVEQYFEAWADQLNGPAKMMRELNRCGVEIRSTQAAELYKRRVMELTHGKRYEEIQNGEHVITNIQTADSGAGPAYGSDAWGETQEYQ